MVQVSRKAQQPKVWVNGQYMPANKSTDGNWYVEIDGKRVKVDPNDLFGMNKSLTSTPEHFISYYENIIEDSKNTRKTLAKLESSLKDQLSIAKEKYNTFLSSIGVKKYNEITNATQRTTAREYRKDLSNISGDITRTKNDYYGECLRGFDACLEKSDWLSQYQLAQHVEQNLT